MRVLVRVAGRSAYWVFRDSEHLGDWIAARPWLAGPRVRVVRLASPESAEPVLGAVQAAAAAADLGTSEVACRRVEAATVAAEGFEAAVLRALGIVADRDRYDALEQASLRLGERPRLFLLPPLPSDRPQTADEAVACADLVSQLAPGARLAVLLTDTRQSPYTGPAFDFTSGEPAQAAAWLTAPVESQWRHYLHLRLAWEAAGDPSLATALGRQMDHLPIGQDVVFERALTHAAVEQAQVRLSDTDRCSLNAGIEALAEPNVRLRPARTAELRDLVNKGFIWSPGNLDELVPSPWLARALLVERYDQAGASLLRGCVVCAPLARDLLSVCLQLEALERGRLIEDDRPGYGAEALESWDAFMASTSLSARLYPVSCPAYPANAWSFASLGKVLTHFPQSDSQRAMRYELLYLRNHLAHGHYVGWEAVRTLLSIVQTLTTRML
jgi:hypothetical protein